MADNAAATTPSPHDRERRQPLSGCLARLLWMGLGNGVLLLTTVSLLQEPPWTVTWRDGLFWLTVATLLSVRYWDVTRLGGLTADGEPATLHHFRRYSVRLLVGTSALWLISHSLRLLS